MQIECVADQLISGQQEPKRAALANAAATLDRLGAASEMVLAKFVELWELLGGGWDGDGGEQILAREVRAGLAQMAARA